MEPGVSPPTTMRREKKERRGWRKKKRKPAPPNAIPGFVTPIHAVPCGEPSSNNPST